MRHYYASATSILYVFLSVCVCFTCVCVFGRLCVYTCTCLFVCSVCMCLYVCVRDRECIYICVCVYCMLLVICLSMCVCVFLFVCSYAFVCFCVYSNSILFSSAEMAIFEYITLFVDSDITLCVVAAKVKFYTRERLPTHKTVTKNNCWQWWNGDDFFNPCLGFKYLTHHV